MERFIKIYFQFLHSLFKTWNIFEWHGSAFTWQAVCTIRIHKSLYWNFIILFQLEWNPRRTSEWYGPSTTSQWFVREEHPVYWCTVNRRNPNGVNKNIWWGHNSARPRNIMNKCVAHLLLPSLCPQDTYSIQPLSEWVPCVHVNYELNMTHLLHYIHMTIEALSNGQYLG